MTLMWCSQIATAPTASARPMAWCISDERKIERGTISEGKIVFLSRLLCSISEVDDRVTVS